MRRQKIKNMNDIFQRLDIYKEYNNLKISVIWMFIVALSFLAIVNYNFYLNYMNSYAYDSSYNISCDNLSLQDTSYCLEDFVRDNFKYRVNDDNNDLNLSELVNDGGDCKDWTDFYEGMLHYYGYNQTERDRVFVEEINDSDEVIFVYHTFLIAYDNTGYCHLDMGNVHCYLYKDSDLDL